MSRRASPCHPAALAALPSVIWDTVPPPCSVSVAAANLGVEVALRSGTSQDGKWLFLVSRGRPSIGATHFQLEASQDCELVYLLPDSLARDDLATRALAD